MSRTFVALTLCCAVLTTILMTSQVNADKDNIVTASQVNGTWKNKTGTFKIHALGKQRLEVSFYGLYKYNSPAGPTANEGEASGIAFIEGDTATFKPEDTGEDDCVITLIFAKDRLTVSQEGSGTCGFGHNVRADGTYRKVSGAK